jgi:peptidoglycan/LPS O-acetylase OafA/YrhL
MPAPSRSAPAAAPAAPPEVPAAAAFHDDPLTATGTQVLDRGWADPSAAPYLDEPDLDADGELAPEDDDQGDDRGRTGRGAARASRAQTSGPRPELPYLAGLDGLRAVALLAILAFHQGFASVRGGFLGISSFFTLSGFLVATLCLAEWAQDGRLALGRFYETRAKRLLPLLVFTVALVVVLQTTLRVGTGPGYRGDVLAALGQVLNWRFALSGDGFASVLTDPSPVQHLWAMSLLIQITVVFPLVFVGLMRLSGRRWRVAGGVFALATVGSFVLASRTAQRAGNDGFAYYGTASRAGELLVGVVVAYAVLSPRIRGLLETDRGVSVLRWGTPVALVGLAWLWHATSIYGANLFGGVTAANALLTSWLILALMTPGLLSGVLGSLPLRTVGRISYAAYLVHWPLFLVIDDSRLDLPGPALFGVRVAATLAAGAALTYGLERPLRRLALPRLNLAAGLAGATAVVALAAIVLPQQPPPGVSLAIGSGASATGPGALDVVVPQGPEDASVALVGGSLAGSLAPGFEAWNETSRNDQIRVATHVAADCPLAGAGPVHLAGATVGDDDACVAFAPRLPKLLDAAKPDVIVVVPGVGDLGDRRIDGRWRHLGDPVFDTWIRQRLSDLADQLGSQGAPVVWTTALPVRLAPAAGGVNGYANVAANDPVRTDRLNEIIHDVVRDRPHTTLLDLDAWAQQLPRGGEFGADTRAEGRDLTPAGAEAAAAWLVPQLVDIAAGRSPDGD